MSELLEKYYSKLSNQYRPSTVKIYKWHLDRFEKWLLSKHKTLDSFNCEDLLLYLKKNSHWNSNTTNHCATIIKTFMNTYYLENLPIGINTEEIRSRLTREQELRAIDRAQIRKIEHSIENKSLSIEEVRKLLSISKRIPLDYCLIWALLYTGMRKGEFLQLHPKKNIIWKENRIHLEASQTKNYLERNIYIDDYTKEVFTYILKEIGSNTNLSGYTETKLNKVLLKYEKPMKRKMFPHMFRHTFVTHMQSSIKGKYDMNDMILIKTLAGHNVKSENITARYTSISEETKRDAMTTNNYMKQFEQ